MEKHVRMHVDSGNRVIYQECEQAILNLPTHYLPAFSVVQLQHFLQLKVINISPVVVEVCYHRDNKIAIVESKGMITSAIARVRLDRVEFKHDCYVASSG
jgi:hypothetical protein